MSYKREGGQWDTGAGSGASRPRAGGGRTLGQGPQEGQAGTSMRRWHPWRAAALMCSVGPWAPHPAASVEHDQDWDVAAASTQCHQTLPLSKRCPHKVLGGLGPFPGAAGCPLTSIFSASLNLWQKISRPSNKPVTRALLNSRQMLLRNIIFWSASWQPGDRETNREREKGHTAMDRRCQHSHVGSGHGYLFWAANEGHNEVHQFSLLLVHG